MIIKYFSGFGTNGGVFFDEYATYTYNKLVELIRQKRLSEGFVEIRTPLLLNCKILQKTGHLNFFADSIYRYKNIGLKPMNCPGAALFVRENYASRNLDVVKIFEVGSVCRKEPRGTWETLKRMPNFTQDDIHIFVFNHDKLLDECLKVVGEWKILYEDILKQPYEVVLSTMPESSFRSEQVGASAEGVLRDVLGRLEIPVKVAEGEGAFYGPKLDLMAFLPDGNQIQISTLQVDFFLAKNLQVSKQATQPIVIHSALFGSIERFMFYLLQIGSLFPYWCNRTPFLFINLLPEKDMNVRRALSYIKGIAGTNVYISAPKDVQTILRTNSRVNFTCFYGQKESENNSIQLRSENGSKTMVLVSFLRTILEEFVDIQKYFGFCGKITELDNILTDD